jgi:hypothetical protein
VPRRKQSLSTGQTHREPGKRFFKCAKNGLTIGKKRGPMKRCIGKLDR